MRIKSSYIKLDDLRFRAYHGVLPQETSVGSDFVVSLRVGYDVTAAMQSDEVSDTLNYAMLYELVQREMAVPSKLLEHVAGRMAQAIADAFPSVASIDLEVTKLNPPMGAVCHGASVEIHLINDKTLQ